MSQVEQHPVRTVMPRRRRKRLVWNAAGLLVALIAIGAAFWLWINSSQFESLVRGRIIARIEDATGGRVEIGSFHLRLRQLEADAGSLVIHGLEDAGEAPYAAVESLQVRVSILGLFSPRILLRELSVVKPQFHLIVYPDGETNQPRPKNPSPAQKPAIDTLFDLKAEHVAVEQGSVDVDSRASGFDTMPRYLPLDFDANDVSLAIKYVPEQGKNPESYHVDAGAQGLSLFRGGHAPSASELRASIEASVDVMRNAAFLRSLRISEHTHREKERVLTISGTVPDFTKLRWEGKATGEFDMRLLDPIFGFGFTPAGVARMDLVAKGDASGFNIDGPVHVDDGAYVNVGIKARQLQVDTRVHVDAQLMHFGDVRVRFPEGGQLEGDLQLEHWAPHPVRTVSVSAAPPEAKPAGPGTAAKKHLWNRKKPAAPAPIHSREVVRKEPPKEITVNGKITARFENVALDTILDIVGQAPFNRLGVDAALNGPATAGWVIGDVNTLKVDATLGLAASGHATAGEAPGTGVIDATYSQHTGVVDLRRLELNLPASRIEAQGRLGAYPLSSPTAISVAFQSGNLGEFDTTLRALGLERKGKSGTEALPVALSGKSEFHGTWTGSLVSPHLDGTLNATQVAIELPPSANAPTQAPQDVRWDSIEANGSYDAERIAILHGRLNRGQEQILLDGTLSAPDAGTPGGREMPSFDSDSLLQAHVRATKVDTNDLFPLLGIEDPVTGTLQADFDVNGQLHSPGGSGWVELDDGAAYGEPLIRARGQGTLEGRVLKLSSVTLTNKAGSVTGSGIYDFDSEHFQAEAHGTGLDIASIERLHQAGENASGRLTFTATASGTRDEPSVEGQASLADLAVDGESLGSLEITAHTVNRALVYEATSRMEAAEVALHGQTEMRTGLETQAQLNFSRFNIGAVLRLAHLEAIKGESALSGTVTLRGPLAEVDQLQGEARLESMAVTVAGVHLESAGGLHATVANGRVTVDPLHVTGENTDLRAQASVELKEPRRLDLAASGSINLKLAETIDSDITAGGTTTFQVEAHGPLANPGLRGKIEFNNGSLSLEDLPNGLSQLHGTLEFNQNRLEVRSLTAMTGGGQLSLGGYLAYQHGLFADLSVTGKSIRIRYPPGVSSLADTTLHLQGSQSSLLLSGNVMLTRFSVSPDLDIAALAAQANTVQPVTAPNAPSNHVRLDVRIQSSPQLNFQNAYAKLAGDVDLRLRGTLASPSLLGRISITEGNATIAGTRYELQRGDILFTNPVRIQPSIDLNATARVQDYDITLGLHGTPDKLSVLYRSDPPLPESDVIALLALGRTQSDQGLYTQQQMQSNGSQSTDVLLGGALNATVSTRVQKLFGAGSVKVDPSYLGALGASTTRITVDEQVGKNVTLTYATNVNTSAQQLLQAEIAINRHVSLLVTRDESDVFSIVVKATRRYR